MLRVKQEVTLDPEAERKANALQFEEREAAEFGTTEAEIGQTEQDAIFIDFGGEPGRGPERIEEAHDGVQIGFAQSLRKSLSARLRIGAAGRRDRV